MTSKPMEIQETKITKKRSDESVLAFHSDGIYLEL